MKVTLLIRFANPTHGTIERTANTARRSNTTNNLPQWEMVETWMATAKRSLGPKAWGCLGASSAFHRTRSRVRQSLGLIPEDGEYQAPVTRGDRSPRTEACSPHAGRAADSEKVVAPGRGRRARDRHEAGAKPRLHQASGRKRGAEKGERRAEAKDDAQEGAGKHEAVQSSWDQHLAEKAALAITAAMWTIATERERITYCATFAAREIDIALNREGGENTPSANASAHQQAARYTGSSVRPRAAAAEDSSPPPMAPALELRVSLAAARRFIKSSRLIDGVFVLDADVDLGFKRWEEAGRSTGRDQHCHCSRDTSRSPVRRSAKGKGGASIADTAATVPPTQRLCEAVGCSDPALYSDVHPLAKSRFCRKHKRIGMVDVGSRR